VSRISIALLIVLVTFASAPLHAAEKLKGFYSGSGGFSEEVHRVLLVEFAADGTAILQQTWGGKAPQTWHAHWVQDGKEVKVTFDAAKDQTVPAPLMMTIDHGTLTATKWDAAALGPLGPPKLAPFGGKNPQRSTVATCQALNARDPTADCVMWDSRRRN
jgi:hypothetical protein